VARRLARLIRAPSFELFAASSAGLWVAVGFAMAWFPRRAGIGGFGPTLWVRADSGYYLAIAHHGYAPDPGNAPAFFPAYPTLIAGLGHVLGSYVIAGLVISLGCCAIVFELLWRLAASRLGAAGGTRTALYLALFPMSLFLHAVYSESLFLALALGAFALAERDGWWQASLLAGCATLTRSVGLAVIAGLAVLAWPSLKRLGWLLLSIAMFAAFPIALSYQVHDPWAFDHAQTQWQRHFTWWGPLGGIWFGIRALWRKSASFTEHFYLAVNIEALVFLALFVALLPLVWRRVGKAYAVFAAAALAIPLSVPASAGDFPLFSFPRFALLAFPCFIALAAFAEHRPRAHTTIVAVSSVALGIAVVQWATGYWVS